MIKRDNLTGLFTTLLVAGIALLLFAGCGGIASPLEPAAEPESEPPAAAPAGGGAVAATATVAPPSEPTPSPTPAGASAAANAGGEGQPTAEPAPPVADTTGGASGASPAAAEPEVTVVGGRSIKQWSSPPPRVIDPSASYSAVISTSAGDITVELLTADAPNTVNNFVFLAREGFYDNVIFHRTIPGFMIQGGDPSSFMIQGGTPTGTGRLPHGPGYRFADEPVRRPYVRGALAMANAGPNTNGSQFFLMHADYPLPPNYTIFGQAVAGLDAIDAIATAPTRPEGEGSSPVNPVAIETVTITGP